MIAMKRQMDIYEHQATDYQQDVAEAISQADQFYEAISGINGFAQWVRHHADATFPAYSHACLNYDIFYEISYYYNYVFSPISMQLR